VAFGQPMGNAPGSEIKKLGVQWGAVGPENQTWARAPDPNSKTRWRRCWGPCWEIEKTRWSLKGYGS